MKLTKKLLNEMIGKNVEDIIETLQMCNDVLGWAYDEDDDLVIEKKNHTEYYLHILYVDDYNTTFCDFWIE